ncbi:MAG: hypothetical protein ACK2U2_06610 [Anaerolineae bacterium]|jgi:hypothetical protein
MTTRNQTERRLLESIRKAKTGETPEPTTAPAETAKGAAPEGTATAAAPDQETDTPRMEPWPADPYQLGRRVWPD